MFFHVMWRYHLKTLATCTCVSIKAFKCTSVHALYTSRNICVTVCDVLASYITDWTTTLPIHSVMQHMYMYMYISMVYVHVHASKVLLGLFHHVLQFMCCFVCWLPKETQPPSCKYMYTCT